MAKSVLQAKYDRNSLFYLKLLLLLVILQLVACSRPSKPVISGYVEGQYIYISTLSAGTLKSLQVTPGMQIKKNQVLFTLEPLLTDENLTIAKARVQAALIEIKKAETRYKLLETNKNRNALLLKKDIISKEVFEQSVMEYQQALEDKNNALANLTSFKAEEKKAHWEIQQKTVSAPKDGIVFDTYYAAGENIQAGSPILSLLEPAQIKIVFFVPEILLGKLRINQPIKVHYDGAQAPIDAKITYISPKASYNPPMIYSTEERQRLVFRIEASPVLKTKITAHPGQPVSIDL
ncbi:hemolysin D [Legionella beliardensis]|uniref:Hemolysin D n=1 Tax=Legionella beliardensis TaxID=91822 RepID=A0A378I1Z5_9GAMM|nr:HlyD family efflux transporter periplasmic adaptor subunit [Legionella beliardensis]STX28740.1 hemolysin D [Legionella beliardensis]